MNAAVLVAYRPGDPSRARPFALVKQFWQESPLPLTVVGEGGADYNVGHAKNAGMLLLPDHVDTVVLADADTIPRSYAQVAEALWIACNRPGLVYCADAIRCLSAAETESCRHWRDTLAARGDGGRETDSMSGLIAISRLAFGWAGGFDERFTGYGFEDLEFRRTCLSLPGGVDAIHVEAIHLWHEPDPGKDPESESFQRNEQLFLRGQRAVA